MVIFGSHICSPCILYSPMWQFRWLFCIIIGKNLLGKFMTCLSGVCLFIVMTHLYPTDLGSIQLPVNLETGLILDGQ